MTDKRDASGARQKDLPEAHLGQVKAEGERESEEKIRHMGSGQKAEPAKEKREASI